MIREYNDNNIRIIEEDGIFFMSYKIEKIDIKIAKEIVAKRIEFTLQSNALLFVDATNVKIIDIASRDYFASEATFVKLRAIAIYANSNFSRFLTAFMLKINRSQTKLPRKLFSDKKKAIKWLNSFRSSNSVLLE